MTIDVDGVHENGILKLKKPVDLLERAEVRVAIGAPSLARTALGFKLLELRSEIARSGAPALGWDEIEEEVAARRGSWRVTR